jgi:LysR family transcriptional activator of nhaA
VACGSGNAGGLRPVLRRDPSRLSRGCSAARTSNGQNPHASVPARAVDRLQLPQKQQQRPATSCDMDSTKAHANIKKRSMSYRELNYRHLYYFWMVAREGHLTRASKLLHVSQSAISSQIHQLEEQVGNALFLREGRTLRLSEAGHLVFAYADGIFSLGRELLETLAAGGEHKRQRLRIGSVSNLSRNFQENFLRPTLAMDSIQLALESGSLEDLLARLAAYKLDLVLANRPARSDADNAWHCRRIARQPVCLVGPPRSGAAPYRFPEDLQGARLILPGRSSDIRMEFDMLCSSLGLHIDIFAEVDDMAMLRLLARDSGHAALTPAVVVQDELRNGVLEQYCVVPDVHESFYAITVERQFQPEVVAILLGAQGA